jgi:hypothetical protein
LDPAVADASAGPVPKPRCSPVFGPAIGQLAPIEKPPVTDRCRKDHPLDPDLDPVPPDPVDLAVARHGRLDSKTRSSASRVELEPSRAELSRGSAQLSSMKARRLVVTHI